MLKICTTVFLIHLYCIVFTQGLRYVDSSGFDTTQCDDPNFPCLTIIYALGQSNPNDTVRISEGIFTEPDGITIDKSIVLQGAGKLLTILQAHNEPEMAASRVITIDGEYNVSIIGTTIRHGFAKEQGVDGLGGGLFCDSCHLILKDVRFLKNVAEISGGGIACSSSTVILSEVDFDENIAYAQSGSGGGGGGIFLKHSTGSFANVFCFKNSASWIGLGGGAFFLNADVTMDYSGIVENDASAGAGIFTGAGSLIISNSFVLGNIAGHNGGGGIYGNSDTLRLKDVTISSNQSDAGGGGLYFSRGFQSLSNVYVRSNRASSFGGGGIYNSNCKPAFEDVVVEDNYSYDYGGGMENRTDSPYTLTGIRFRNNEARYQGGGLSHRGDSLQIQHVEFDRNKAERGGGLYTSGTTHVEYCTFSKNQATDSGGGLNFDGPLQLSNISFIENTAANAGGGMNSYGTFFERKYPYLYQVIFRGNSAGGGGGMGNGAYSYPILESVLFDGNIAEYGGGFYNTHGSPIFLNTWFENNSAAYGGGLYHAVDTVTAVNALFTGNVSSAAGGAIYNAGDDNIAWMQGQLKLINSTITLNSSPFGGGIYNIYNSNADILNSVIWNNTGLEGKNIYNGEVSSSVLRFSLCGDSLADVVAGESIEFFQCVNTDPLFLNADDYRLTSNSPCIDSGDPDTDVGIFPGDSITPVDFDLNPRIINSRIDMGAFERQEIVAVKKDFEGSIAIYPNPASNFIFIRGIEKIQNLTIRNLKGQICWEDLASEWHEKGIDISSLANGMYILNIVLEKSQLAIKLVKNDNR